MIDFLRILSPGHVAWKSIDLPVSAPGPLGGLRILHVTDLHFTRFWYAAHDALLDQIAAAKVDVICFTGDLVDNRWNPTAALANAERFMNGLRSRFGTFAIIGNHDGDLLAPHLAGWNCHLLHPGFAKIHFGGGVLEIIGLPCVSRKDIMPRVLDRFSPKPENAVRIVLSHYPDHAPRIRSLNADIILAGHTHGGQVCLPGARPIITHDGLPKRMSAGVHRVDNSWLVVSRGVGFATIPIRIFAPPEIIQIELK